MNGPKIPAGGNRRVRDAIVMSGWAWQAANTPERVALALAHLGARVLYCENPISRFRAKAGPVAEIHPGVYRLLPRFLGHRLNRLSLGFDHLQAKMIARQVLDSASRLKLNNPLFFYPHGDFFVPVCREFKRLGFPLVHICFDYPEPGQDRHIALSDLTVTVPRTVSEQLKAKYERKIAFIPQVRWPLIATSQVGRTKNVGEIIAIPRPRLGYTGVPTDRLNLRALDQLFRRKPDWHFVHFGDSKCLPLPNVHAIAWRKPEEVDNVVANLDVGFMPYDCFSNKNFHCMPLKVFDYFLAGIPVVSTPIVNLWEYSDTIYFGDDAEGLRHAIDRALAEPSDSPLKAKRIAIGRENSIETLASVLAQVLASCPETSYAAAD